MSIEKNDLKAIIFDILNTYTDLLNELGLTTEDLSDVTLFSDDLMDLTKAMTNKLLDMSGIEGGIGVDDLTIEYAQTDSTVEIRVEASFKMVMAIINVYKELINGNMKVLKNFMTENSELIGSLIKEMSESSQESIKKIATIITDAIDPEKFINSSWASSMRTPRSSREFRMNWSPWSRSTSRTCTRMMRMMRKRMAVTTAKVPAAAVVPRVPVAPRALVLWSSMVASTSSLLLSLPRSLRPR